MYIESLHIYSFGIVSAKRSDFSPLDNVLIGLAYTDSVFKFIWNIKRANFYQAFYRFTY